MTSLIEKKIKLYMIQFSQNRTSFPKLSGILHSLALEKYTKSCQYTKLRLHDL